MAEDLEPNSLGTSAARLAGGNLGTLYFINGARPSDLKGRTFGEKMVSFHDGYTTNEGYRVDIGSSASQVADMANGNVANSHVFYRSGAEGLEAEVARLTDSGFNCYEVGN